MNQPIEPSPSPHAVQAAIETIVHWLTDTIHARASHLNLVKGAPPEAAPAPDNLVKGDSVKATPANLVKGTPTTTGIVKPALAPDLARTDGRQSVPDFFYHGGPVINTPKVRVLFIGDWTSPANKERAERLTVFIRDLLKSTYMNILSQYGCGTTGTVAEPVFIERKDNELSADEIHRILQDAIDDGSVPEPDSSSAHVLYLDDSTAVNDTAAGAVMCEAASDTAFGYHDFFPTTAGNPCYFAVIPGLTETCLKASCPGDDAGCSVHLRQTQEQRQTQVASHELAEMLSDPEVGLREAWTAPGEPHENGDICNGRAGTITVGKNTWTVQLMYSKLHDLATNGAITCIAETAKPLPSLVDLYASLLP